MADQQNKAISGGFESSFQDFVPPPKSKRNIYALACSLLASMASILLGYDTGVMSGATIYIKEDLKITDVQIEILVGTINIYSLVGAAVAGRTSDWVGRRYTIVIAAVIFFVGPLLMGFATNYAFLMVGRFVAGIGVGYAMMIAPVYTAEIAPNSTRGFLTSFPEVFINFGIAATGWILFDTLLPETRGRSLEEMEELFGTFFRWRPTIKELESKKLENDMEML